MEFKIHFGRRFSIYNKGISSILIRKYMFEPPLFGILLLGASKSNVKEKRFALQRY